MNGMKKLATMHIVMTPLKFSKFVSETPNAAPSAPPSQSPQMELKLDMLIMSA